MLVGDEVVMSSKRTKPDRSDSKSEFDMSNRKVQLLKERVFLKDKATQVELCCSARLDDDDDDHDQDGDDNRSRSSRRSRHRNDDDDEEYEDDNLNYERND